MSEMGETAATAQGYLRVWVKHWIALPRSSFDYYQWYLQKRLVDYGTINPLGWVSQTRCNNARPLGKYQLIKRCYLTSHLMHNGQIVILANVSSVPDKIKIWIFLGLMIMFMGSIEAFAYWNSVTSPRETTIRNLNIMLIVFYYY